MRLDIYCFIVYVEDGFGVIGVGVVVGMVVGEDVGVVVMLGG